MTRPRPLPPEFHDLPFSRRAALSRGLTDRRLRASDLSSPFHAVRCPSDSPGDIQWLCRAYQERMPPGSAFSHVTAAMLYGLPVPLYVPTSRLHVAVPAPRKPPRGRGVVGHEVSPDAWESRDLVHLDPHRHQLFALPTVTPQLAWTQLAASLDVRDLVAVGDALVGGDPPLATVDDLRRAVVAWGARRGARALAAAVGQVRVGSLSRAESLLRLQLMEAGLPEPALNFRVADPAGNPIAMADLVWPRYRLVLEYEGDGHRTSRSKFRSDITRGEHYADGNWFAMRAHAWDVFGDPNDLVARVARRLRERGWLGPVELPRIAAARS